MRLESYHWPQSQSLSEHYLHRFDQVESLFDYNPAAAESWTNRAQWLDHSAALRADRNELVAALAKYNSRITDFPALQNNIMALRDARTLVVVGGQQAGLFTGPLYVIYKAITLLQTARTAAATLGRPVVPVFWIAGEDHDFDEVNHTFVLTPQLQVQKLKIEHPEGKRTSVSQTVIDPQTWRLAIEQLDAALPETEFKAHLLEEMRQFSSQSSTLTDFFALTFGEWFGKYGLILIDSDDSRFRRLEGAMFQRLIANRNELAGAFETGKRSVEALGFTPQADVQTHCVNLFVYHDGERKLLFEEQGCFTDRKGEQLYDEQELLALAVDKPERLSNNALTRPLMQDYLFPVLAAILGPGEIAYWALTRQAFQTMNMRMPIAVPRTEYTLIEGTVQKQLHKFGLSFADAVSRLDETIAEWLEERDTLKLDEQFARIKAQFIEMYNPLIRAVSEFNPGLGKLGDTNRQKIIEQIDYFANRASDAYRSQFDTALRQFERIRHTVLPHGSRQERVYNICAYLNRYGRAWLEELIELPVEMDGLHRVVYM